MVPEFCTCGVRLPEDARFCHKCGKPQYDYPGLAEEDEPAQPPPLPAATQQRLPEISFHNRLAVRVGLLAALLGVLPFVSLLPIPFVSSLIAFLTGFLAVFSYCRLTGETLSIRSGARMGWIAGIFSFTFVAGLLAVLMLAFSTQGKFSDLLHQPETQKHFNADQIQQLTRLLQDPAGLAVMGVVILLMLFVMLTALPVLGGAFGAKVFNKQ